VVDPSFSLVEVEASLSVVDVIVEVCSSLLVGEVDDLVAVDMMAELSVEVTLELSVDALVELSAADDVVTAVRIEEDDDVDKDELAVVALEARVDKVVLPVSIGTTVVFVFSGSTVVLVL
jgi:hypothetical protein